MPSFYIHERAALSVLCAECDACAVALGACGPDALYFSGAGEVRTLGKLLHSQRTGEFLTYLVRVCADDAVCRDYALGFLSHYAVDVAFHPFVYALSINELGYSSIKHLAAEHALDAWLMGLSRVPRSGAPSDGVLGEIIARLGAAIMLWQPDAQLDASELRHAFKRCMTVGGALGHFSGEGSQVRVDGMAGEEYVTPDQLQSLANSGWRNPWTGDVSHLGPFELLGESLRHTGELERAAHSYWHGNMSENSLRGAIGDLSYLSGLDWRTSPPPEPIELGRVNAVKRVLDAVRKQ